MNTNEHNTSPEKKVPCSKGSFYDPQCADCIAANEKLPTHDQIQWKKEITDYYGEDAWHNEKLFVENLVERTLKSTLQHLHDEIMEKKWFISNGLDADDVVSVSDLQEIFTRYGVGDKS